MYRCIVFLIVSLFLSVHDSQAVLESTILTYDCPAEGKSLRVSLKGAAKDFEWVAREALPKDIPFYEKLFATPEVGSTFGDGQPPAPGLIRRNMETFFLPKIAEGHPTSLSLTISRSDSEKPVGRVMLIEKGPGVVEVGYAYITDVQGQGLGRSVLREVCGLLRETSRVGRGIGLDFTKDQNIISACQCQGEPLKTVVATASPSNVASWKILVGEGFQPEEGAPSSLDFTHVPYKRDPNNWKQMEDKLCELSSEYKADSLYRCLDLEGNPRTFSLHQYYKRPKYHFRLPLEAGPGFSGSVASVGP